MWTCFDTKAKMYSEKTQTLGVGDGSPMRISNIGEKGKRDEEKWEQVKEMRWSGNEEGKEKVGEKKGERRGGATREKEGKKKRGQESVEEGPRIGEGG